MQKNKQKKNQKKKNTCFTGGETFQVGSVGTFFLPGGKDNSPKNTKISHKSNVFFFGENLEKDFQLFSKISSQIFLTLTKNGQWFYIVLAN